MASNKLVKNKLNYSVGEILPRAVSFFLLPIYTRFLTPVDYGISSYTSTIVGFLCVLGAFSLNSYALRFYFVYVDEESRKSLLGSVQLVIVGLNALILLLAFSIAPSIVGNLCWDLYNW